MILKRFLTQVGIVGVIVALGVALIPVVKVSAFGTPGWWSGECNVNNNPGSYALGASFNGVKACGGGTSRMVHFFSGAWGEYEWECVELSMRYMYLAYGIAPYGAHGKDVVWNYSGNRLTKVHNNGGSLPSPGDILSHTRNGTQWQAYGHTSVVTGVNVDANGNGSVTIMEQNQSTTGSRTISVTNKVLSDQVTGWLHDPLSTTSTSSDPNTDLQMLLTIGSAVYAKNTVGSGGWNIETVNGTATKIAAGGNTQMMIDSVGKVWARNTIGSTGWVQETDAGVGADIAVSSTGVQMVLVTNGEVWAKNSIGYGGWTSEASAGTATAIAVGGNTQMMITSNGTVYAKDSIGAGGWHQETDAGVGADIAISSTGVQMVLVTNGDIWAKNSIGYGGWTSEAGAGWATAIAVGGNTQMFINNSGMVYAKNSIGAGGWHQETDANVAAGISVSSNGLQLVETTDGQVWAKTSIGYGNWTQEAAAGTATEVVASQ